MNILQKFKYKIFPLEVLVIGGVSKISSGGQLEGLMCLKILILIDVSQKMDELCLKELLGLSYF